MRYTRNALLMSGIPLSVDPAARRAALLGWWMERLVEGTLAPFCVFQLRVMFHSGIRHPRVPDLTERKGRVRFTSLLGVVILDLLSVSEKASPFPMMVSEITKFVQWWSADNQELDLSLPVFHSLLMAQPNPTTWNWGLLNNVFPNSLGEQMVAQVEGPLPAFKLVSTCVV